MKSSREVVETGSQAIFKVGSYSAAWKLHAGLTAGNLKEVVGFVVGPGLDAAEFPRYFPKTRRVLVDNWGSIEICSEQFSGKIGRTSLQLHQQKRLTTYQRHCKELPLQCRCQLQLNRLHTHSQQQRQPFHITQKSIAWSPLHLTLPVRPCACSGTSTERRQLQTFLTLHLL